jgi:hypothetical protein
MSSGQHGNSSSTISMMWPRPSDVALVLGLADGFQKGLDFSPAAGAESGVGLVP